MKKSFSIQNQKFTVEIQNQISGFYTGISEDGKSDSHLAVESFEIIGNDSFRIRTSLGDSYGKFYVSSDDCYILLNGKTIHFKSVFGDSAGPESQGTIKSPMPGKIVQVPVTVGQEIHPDTTVVVVESMKMENAIKGAIPGVIKAVHCKAGDLISPDDVLIEIEPK